jgi:hypothetical protein
MYAPHIGGPTLSKRLMLIVSAALMVAMALGATVAVAQSGGDDDALHAKLRGSAETPAGDTNGKGSASVVIDGRTVCLAIAFADLDRVAAAHIHRGAQGVNGPIVVDPKFSPTSGRAGTLSGCVTAKASVARAIRRNPSGYYANVHTGAFPGGAIRGQLSSE